MKELAEMDNKGMVDTGYLKPNSTGGAAAQLPLVSLVIPAYNEEANIPRLESELNEAIKDLPYRFEIILIDNHSTDSTGRLIKAICERDSRWRYILFRRNFHVESSIAAGYHFAKGEAMIVLYSDLQEPPSVIPQFLKSWQEGFDIVHGVHTKRVGEQFLFSILVKCAYRFVSWCSETPIPPDAGDFRLISKRVRDALEQCGDYHRYTRGLIAWLGFPQTTVNYVRQPRLAGKATSNFSIYWRYFSNAITSFSLKPLRLFSVLGLASFAVSALLVLLSLSLHGDREMLLFTALAALQFFIGALTFLGIGFLGEYCGRTYTEVKHRPLYIIQEVVNIQNSAVNYTEAQTAATRQG
jgi:polyisoprenyl-phosphate glycosyltransferase